MSTIEDFENAPIGATATSPDGGKAVKTFDSDELPWLSNDSGWCSSDDMSRQGFTIDPTHPAPTTAREALALAWELSHPVKEGQVIPAGTLCLAQFDDGYQSYETPGEVITSETLPDIRTFDPLPDPEPDWLDAPAVLAWSRWDDVRREKVWSKDDECYKNIDGEVANWSDLCYVTPLYPKGQDA